MSFTVGKKAVGGRLGGLITYKFANSGLMYELGVGQNIHDGAGRSRPWSALFSSTKRQNTSSRLIKSIRWMYSPHKALEPPGNIIAIELLIPLFW